MATAFTAVNHQLKSGGHRAHWVKSVNGNKVVFLEGTQRFAGKLPDYPSGYGPVAQALYRVRPPQWNGYVYMIEVGGYDAGTLTPFDSSIVLPLDWHMGDDGPFDDGKWQNL